MKILNLCLYIYKYRSDNQIVSFGKWSSFDWRQKIGIKRTWSHAVMYLIKHYAIMRVPTSNFAKADGRE